ncbi:FAD-dependent monooxygenase [Saccharothrix sp. NPDC042600]|uniref:FAD-dependent monooxygenase n=1 Tax=Saccharothrix TaxID=2071 RepID=UPI0033C39E4D|nr:FAD-dependent monooxygenase [Saccharothrix mutabilis subsp. capreolus]
MVKALVIGGGIAGPVTALALRKAGIDSAVFEAYPTGADDIGAFLTIMHNGLDALRAIDAEHVVVDHSFAADGVDVHTGDGTLVSENRWDTGGITGPRTLRRAELYRALHDELRRRGIAVEHGKRLVGVTAGARAKFADGTTAEGDLLVGADGLHSATRRIIDPDAPRPRYTGLNIFYGYATGLGPTTAPGRYRMIAGSRGFFGHSTAPDGTTWWFARTPGPERHGGTPDEHRAHAAAFFAEDDSRAREIILAEGEIHASNAYDVPTTPVWHTDRVVLVGDAAHAASPAAGQGASMALEDSVTLARCLRDLSSPREAFEAYERLRRERVEALVEMSAELGANRSVATNSFYAHHIDWDSPVQL